LLTTNLLLVEEGKVGGLGWLAHFHQLVVQELNLARVPMGESVVANHERKQTETSAASVESNHLASLL
jgi:hypothetical protein